LLVDQSENKAQQRLFGNQPTSNSARGGLKEPALWLRENVSSSASSVFFLTN
jgi:hypothetical protein